MFLKNNFKFKKFELDTVDEVDVIDHPAHNCWLNRLSVLIEP